VLILTRRFNEKIVVETPSGEVIEFIPLAVNGSQIKIGVNAAPDIAIDREEIAISKKESKNANKSE